MDFIGVRWIPPDCIPQMDSDEVHRTAFLPSLMLIRLPVLFRVITSGYLTYVRGRQEYSFAYSTGKPLIPSNSIGVYWKCMKFMLS